MSGFLQTRTFVHADGVAAIPPKEVTQRLRHASFSRKLYGHSSSSPAPRVNISGYNPPSSSARKKPAVAAHKNNDPPAQASPRDVADALLQSLERIDTGNNFNLYKRQQLKSRGSSSSSTASTTATPSSSSSSRTARFLRSKKQGNKPSGAGKKSHSKPGQAVGDELLSDWFEQAWLSAGERHATNEPQRDIVRERICFATLQGVIQRVGEVSPQQSVLLNRLFSEWALLQQNKARHRLDLTRESMTKSMDVRGKALETRFEQAVRAQKHKMVQLQVQNEHLTSERREQGMGMERMFEKTKEETLQAVKKVTDKEIEVAQLTRDLHSAHNQLERQLMLYNKTKQQKFQLEDDLEQSHSVHAQLRETIASLEEQLVDKRDRAQDKETQFNEEDTPDHFKEMEKRREIKAVRILQRAYRRYIAHKAARLSGTSTAAAFRATEAFRKNDEEQELNLLVPRSMKELIDARMVRKRIASVLRVALNETTNTRQMALSEVILWMSELLEQHHKHNGGMENAAMVSKEEEYRGFSYYLYDRYLITYGDPDTAEFHLMQLFRALRRYVHHPRVAIYWSLLNMEFGSDRAPHLLKLKMLNRHATTDDHLQQLEQQQQQRIIHLSHGGRLQSDRLLAFYSKFIRFAASCVVESKTGTRWIALDDMQHLLEYVFRATPSEFLQHVREVMSQNAKPRGDIPEFLRYMQTIRQHAKSSASVSQLRLVNRNDSNVLVCDFDVVLMALLKLFVQEDERMDMTLVHRLNSIMYPFANVEHAAKLREERLQKLELQDTASSTTEKEQKAPVQEEEEEENDPYKEAISFTRFCELVDAIGSSWDERKLLHVYSMAVRLRPRAELDINAVVFALRTHQLAPVLVTFPEFDSVADVFDRQKRASERDEAERKHRRVVEKRLIHLSEQLAEQELKWSHKCRTLQEQKEQMERTWRQRYELATSDLQAKLKHEKDQSQTLLHEEKLKSASEFNDLFDQYQQELAVQRGVEENGEPLSEATRMRRLLAFRERIMQTRQAEAIMAAEDDDDEEQEEEGEEEGLSDVSVSDFHEEEEEEESRIAALRVTSLMDDDEEDSDTLIRRVANTYNSNDDKGLSREPSLPLIVDSHTMTPPMSPTPKLASMDENEPLPLQQQPQHRQLSHNSKNKTATNHKSKKRHSSVSSRGGLVRTSSRDIVRLSDYRAKVSTLKKYCKKLKLAKFELEKETSNFQLKYKRMTQIADRLSMKLEDLGGRFIQHTRRKRMILEDQTRIAQHNRQEMLKMYSQRDWTAPDSSSSAVVDVALRQEALEQQQAAMFASTPTTNQSGVGPREGFVRESREHHNNEQQLQDNDSTSVQQQQQQQQQPTKRKLPARNRPKRHSNFHKLGGRVVGNIPNTAALPTIYSPRTATNNEFDYKTALDRTTTAVVPEEKEEEETEREEELKQ